MLLADEPAWAQVYAEVGDFLAEPVTAGALSRNALPLADLTPDPHAISHAGGAYARVLSTRSGEYAIYLDGDGPTTITLDLPAGDYAPALQLWKSRLEGWMIAP